MRLKNAHTEGLITTEEYFYSLITQDDEVFRQHAATFDGLLLASFRIWCYSIYRGQEMFMGSAGPLTIPPNNPVVMKEIENHRKLLRSENTHKTIEIRKLAQILEIPRPNNLNSDRYLLHGQAIKCILGVLAGFSLKKGTQRATDFIESLLSIFLIASQQTFRLDGSHHQKWSLAELESEFGFSLYLGAAIRDYIDFSRETVFVNKHISYFLYAENPQGDVSVQRTTFSDHEN